MNHKDTEAQRSWRLALGVFVSLCLCGWYGLGQPELPASLGRLFASGVDALNAGQLDDAEKAFLRVLQQGGKRAFVYNNLGVLYQRRGHHDRAVGQFRLAIQLQPNYAAPRALLGASLLALGRIREAITELERAVKFLPNEPLVRLQLARAYEHAGDLPGALEQYGALRASAPQEAEYLYQLGRVHAKLSEWSYARIKRLHPGSARLYQVLGHSYLAQGRVELAIAALRQAAEADPKLPEIHLALAQIYVKQDKEAEALREIEQELAIVPESQAALAIKEKLQGGPELPRLPEGLARRAELDDAIRARDYARAETLLVEETEKNPKSPGLLTLLGGIFFLEGKYLNAAIALKKAEALAPLDENSRFTLAMSYVVLDRRDWARPELEKLERVDPQNAAYLYWLARLDYDDARYQAAIGRLQQVLELDFGHVKAHDNLGLCYEALGKSDAAIEHYGKAVGLNRQQRAQSPWPALNLGALLLKLGRLDEAEDYLRESLRDDPKLAQAHYQLGVLLEKKGKDAEALAELNQAATSDPSYPEPHYALARIHRRLGQREKAEQELAVFQELKARK